MAIFLNKDQAYRILQRELPEGVYPDGAPSGYYSTASLYAKATLIEDAYNNMQVIYLNNFPQTADEKQADWEIKAFGKTLDAAIALSERRLRVIAKLRNRSGITKQDMIDAVKSVIGTDKDVAIQDWGSKEGSWYIGESELGFSTYLNGARIFELTYFLFPGVDICALTAADLGWTDAELLNVRQGAYTYSVLIYSYTMTDAERTELDLLLTIAEPARSTHVIEDGLDPALHI